MSSMALKKSRSRPGSKNRVWIAAIFVCALVVAVYVFPFARFVSCLCAVSAPSSPVCCLPFLRQPTFHSVHPARVAVDMHTHTTESDGDFTAEEVIEFAKSRGLSAVWITDHDMIRSMERTQSLLRDAALVRLLAYGLWLAYQRAHRGCEPGWHHAWLRRGDYCRLGGKGAPFAWVSGMPLVAAVPMIQLTLHLRCTHEQLLPRRNVARSVAVA